MRLAELYAVGERVDMGSVHFSAEDIIRFASKFDPQPFHLEEEAAKASLFGGLCASGWHTCAGWMQRNVAFFRGEARRLIGEGKTPPKMGPSPGFRNLVWPKPVYAGDTITYSLTPVSSRPMTSRPGWHMNTALAEGMNQHGETVLRFESNVIDFE